MNIKNTQEKAWKQTLIVDKKQIQSLTKDIPKLFSFSMTVSPFSQKLSKLLSQHQQSAIKITKEQRSTFMKLSQINTQTSAFRQLLKKYDQTNEYLVKVQNNSQKILHKLQHFRQKMGIIYEDLADEQDKLKDQLQLFDKKIQMFGREEYHEEQKENVRNVNREVKIWQRQKQKQIRATSPKIVDKNTQKLDIIEARMKQKQKQVELVDKQLMILGKNLGWPQQDHIDFISIWNRSPNKNYFQIQQQLKGYFAYYTAQQIQEHMNKYLKFKKLSQQKKQLICRFKSLKQQRKVQQLRLLNLQRDKSKQEKLRNELRKKQEQQQQQMKYKIIEWKQIKIKEKQLQKQRKRWEQQQKKREQMMRRRQENEYRKLKVEEWKEKQNNQQEQLKRIQSARKPPAIDKQAQERIRLREELLVMKKIQTLNQKKREEELIRKKQEKIKQEKTIKYSYVNNKLEHKTVAMKEKEREKFDGKDKKDANTFGGQLLMTGVRATPMWMKGL